MPPEIVRSQRYETPALEWLFSQVQHLKASLTESGVGDVGMQRSICEGFFFGLAVELDEEALSERRSRLRLAFEDDVTLLLPDDETFAMHEYVYGVVGEAFGDT